MAQEHEIFARVRDDLKRGRELCLQLKRNAVEVAPRELTYIELRTLCRRLEESCRQTAHQRGDDERRTGFPWIELGHHFKKLSDAVQKARRRAQANAFEPKRWLVFGELATVFEFHMHKMNERIERATGLSSLSGQLLILPPHLQDRRAQGGHIILPP